ncbi:MAG: dihydrodipicolinate synthase family protein [Candidatus Caldatribacteriota bacterium]
MSNNIDFSGIFPPIVTPFQKEVIAYNYLIENIEKLSNSGIRGLVVLGSNGESVFLSEEEKIEIVKTVIRTAAKDRLIIVGSGCESARETIYLSNKLANLGAHAALIVTPFYYGSKMNNEALINYYSTIADHTEIPILLYNVPKFTGINLSLEVLSVLSQHPNIIGIKDSSGNVNQLGQYLNKVDDNFGILVGTAGALLGALVLGCKGGVLALANLIPEKCVEIYRLVQQNKLKEARELQLRMIPVNHAVTTIYGISGLKYAMDLIGYRGGETRLPLLPLKKEEKEKIRNILREAGLYRN